MNKKYRIAALSVMASGILLLSTGAANAALIYEKDPIPVAVTEKLPEDATFYMTFDGKTPTSVERVEGAARNMPLVKALKKIVPEDWKAFGKSLGAAQKKRVNFDGDNIPWLDALYQVLKQANISAKVDWDKKEITFSDMPTHIIKR